MIILMEDAPNNLNGGTEGEKGVVLGKPTTKSVRIKVDVIPCTTVRYSAGTATS